MVRKKLFFFILLFTQVCIADPAPQDKKEIERKRAETIKLVKKAEKYFNTNDLEESFAAFTHNQDFLKGELYIFAYDYEGFSYAHGGDKSLIWKNGWNSQDDFGAYFVRDMVKKAQEGGGWITYEWKGASKVSFIQPVKKGELTFLIGAGYYPHSKADAAINLVKGAVSAFNKVSQLDQPLDRAWGQMSYSLGQFVKGNLYLFAARFDGLLVAQGERPSFIGSYVLGYKDQKGVPFNQLIIDKLKENPKWVWIEYMSKNAQKRTYAQKITDKKGNDYFIACGYYPTAGRQKAVDLVRQGYKFMKTSGLSLAAEDFTNERNNDFRYGDLYLVVWDLKGIVRAQGKNPELIGANELAKKDQDGRYYVQDIIKKAQEGGGWVLQSA